MILETHQHQDSGDSDYKFEFQLLCLFGFPKLFIVKRQTSYCESVYYMDTTDINLQLFRTIQLLRTITINQSSKKRINLKSQTIKHGDF